MLQRNMGSRIPHGEGGGGNVIIRQMEATSLASPSRRD
jgi:hypothetical protein